MTREPVSARLILRPWRDADRAPFAALNADPEVMRHFPAVKSREESDRTIDEWSGDIAARGWGLWAAELAASGRFIGAIGLTVPRHPLPFAPCVEIGWRLAREYWGNGYASEGAGSCLRFGFEELRLPEIVSFTAVSNRRSRAVMERIGMINLGEDFDHPAVARDSPVRRHCLYRITRERWAGIARERP